MVCDARKDFSTMDRRPMTSTPTFCLWIDSWWVNSAGKGNNPQLYFLIMGDTNTSTCFAKMSSVSTLVSCKMSGLSWPDYSELRERERERAPAQIYLELKMLKIFRSPKPSYIHRERTSLLWLDDAPWITRTQAPARFHTKKREEKTIRPMFQAEPKRDFCKRIMH